MTFLLVFLSIYTTLHLYFFFRVKALLPPSPWAYAGTGLFLALMIVAPIGVHLAEKAGHDLAARITAWIAFSWMGILFLAVVAGLLVHLAALGAWAVAALTPVRPPPLTGRAGAGVTLAMVALFIVYGRYEAGRLEVTRLTVPTAKLPAGTGALTVVQISDVHLGLLARAGRMSRIVDRIREIGPDLLVSTGDFVDGRLAGLPHLAREMADLRVPLGKYAVTGNHEFYPGLEESLRFLRSAGFRVLRNEAVTVAGVLNIAGVDDPAVEPDPDEAEIFRSLENGRFTLYLKHRPSVSPETLGRFDLQLSGHAHRGQIYPFTHVVALEYPRLDGWYDLGKGGRLYTSRGTGTWGPQIRILSPPEITVIRLVPAPEPEGGPRGPAGG